MDKDSSSKTTDKRSSVKTDRFADNISVLHVDDEEAFLKATKIYLEDMGEGKLEVVSLINPEHVFRTLQEKAYDVIVADYQMPSIDGLQLLKQLRDQNVTIPYIILTGHGREEIAIQALNLGANRYIKKGMDTKSQFRELIHAIQQEVRHKRTQNALRESEEKFRLLGENIEIGLSIVQEGKLVYGNDSFFEITGFPKEEILGTEIYEFNEKHVHPEDLAFVQEQLQKKTSDEKDGLVPRYQYRWYSKNNQLKWIEVISKSITFQGKSALLGAIIDITGQKQAEIALQESEDRHRNLSENFNRILNSMVDGVYIVNAQHEIEFVNSVLKQEFGSPIGKKCYEYFHDRTESCPWCQNEKVFTGKTVRWEWTSSKNERVYDLIDTPLKNPDGSVSKLEIFRDITERKQAEDALKESERKYRSFVENFQGIAFRGYEDFSVDLFSGNIEEITGYTEDDFISGKMVYDQLIHPEDISRINSEVTEFLSPSRRTTEREYRIIDKNGKLHWIHEYIQKFYNEARKMGAVYGTLQDITIRKQAEENLLIINRELQDFASIVAHDLKAPLRNITNLVEWILRDSGKELSEEGKDNLNLIVKQTTHMNALVDGIYQYSKIDRIHKKITQLNLNELLSDVIKILSPPRNIEISIQTELPVLAIDKTHVIQIFSNLLDNAVKFIDKPKGHITIKCEEKQNYWRFSVADNGPGIEERYFERVFQIFQALSTWDESKGTGIGLAIVKKLVEMNGGIVWLESTLKEGSTFFFTLPKG